MGVSGCRARGGQSVHHPISQSNQPFKHPTHPQSSTPAQAREGNDAGPRLLSFPSLACPNTHRAAHYTHRATPPHRGFRPPSGRSRGRRGGRRSAPPRRWRFSSSCSWLRCWGVWGERRRRRGLREEERGACLRPLLQGGRTKVDRREYRRRRLTPARNGVCVSLAPSFASLAALSACVSCRVVPCCERRIERDRESSDWVSRIP